jgi:hypothetical protein
MRILIDPLSPKEHDMPADAYAGHAGNNTPEVRNNQENKAPADRTDYNPADYANVPGAAAREAGYPRLS